jgi:hypothetical protein
MGVLDFVVHSDPSLVLLGHPLAHALGYAVRSTPRTATKLLTECDDRYQSGCYHGILQRYFDARMGMPIAQSVLVAPCDGLRGTREQFRIFDCLHGTGHGLMMYHSYDVNASLQDWWSAEAFGQRRLLGLTPLFAIGLGEVLGARHCPAFAEETSTPCAKGVSPDPNNGYFSAPTRSVSQVRLRQFEQAIEAGSGLTPSL